MGSVLAEPPGPILMPMSGADRLGGHAILWKHMHNAEFTKLVAPEFVHTVFFCVAAAVLCVFTALYLCKMGCHPEVVAAEWACLVRCNFS